MVESEWCAIKNMLFFVSTVLLCLFLPLCVYIWLQEVKADEKTVSPPSGTPTTGPVGIAMATASGGVSKENGVKEPTPTPFGGDGLREPLSIDKRITETSGCKHTLVLTLTLTELKDLCDCKCN